jgi:ABC-type glucose/galactose transport system permease subunit
MTHEKQEILCWNGRSQFLPYSPWRLENIPEKMLGTFLRISPKFVFLLQFCFLFILIHHQYLSYTACNDGVIGDWRSSVRTFGDTAKIRTQNFQTQVLTLVSPTICVVVLLFIYNKKRILLAKHYINDATDGERVSTPNVCLHQMCVYTKKFSKSKWMSETKK